MRTYDLRLTCLSFINPVLVSCWWVFTSKMYLQSIFLVVGLLSQALMLIVIAGFLFSETLSEFWKTKVPINSRNLHDVIFRVVEIGVAIW